MSSSMHRVWLVGALLLSAGACTGTPQPGRTLDAAAAPDGEAVKQITAIEQETGERWKAHDVEYFDRLLADSAVLTTPDGRFSDKAEFLAELRADYRVELSAIDGLQVQLFGSTAVARGTCHNVGVFEGKPFDSSFAFVDTFRWDGQRWQLVALANSRLRSGAPGGAGVRLDALGAEAGGATGVPCGRKTCAAGQVCCNASCGICTEPGGVCIKMLCPELKPRPTTPGTTPEAVPTPAPTPSPAP